MEVICRFEDCGVMEWVNKVCRRCGEVFCYVIVIGRVKYNLVFDFVDVMKGYCKKNFLFFFVD